MSRKWNVSWMVDTCVEAETKEDAIAHAQEQLNGFGYSIDEITDQEPLEVREMDEEEWIDVTGGDLDPAPKHDPGQF